MLWYIEYLHRICCICWWCALLYPMCFMYRILYINIPPVHLATAAIFNFQWQHDYVSVDFFPQTFLTKTPKSLKKNSPLLKVQLFLLLSDEVQILFEGHSCLTSITLGVPLKMNEFVLWKGDQFKIHFNQPSILGGFMLVFRGSVSTLAVFTQFFTWIRPNSEGNCSHKTW